MSATRTLEFAVKGQQITCDYAIPEAVNESREYLHAHFTVDEAWSGLTIFALFYNRVCAAEPIELDETMTCAVPAVVLEKPVSEFLVGLVGYGANGYRLTTDRAGIDLGQAAYTSGATIKPPTPDVYAQLLEQVVRKLDANQGAEHAGKTMIVGADGNVVPGEMPVYSLAWAAEHYPDVVVPGTAGAFNVYTIYIHGDVTKNLPEGIYYCSPREQDLYGIAFYAVNDATGEETLVHRWTSTLSTFSFFSRFSNNSKCLCGYTIGAAEWLASVAIWDQDDWFRINVFNLVSNQWVESNFLKKTNTTEYTPTKDYHPATKKYVDDTSASKADMIITITANDDGTYATDTAYADIAAAIEAGKNVIARRVIVSGSGTTVREYQLAYDYATEDTASTQALSFVYHFPASTSELRAEVISIYDMTHDTVPSAEVAVKSYKYSHAEMVGATETEAGAAGLVPAPAAGEQDMVLHGDGTWRATGSNIVIAREYTVEEDVDTYLALFPTSECAKIIIHISNTVSPTTGITVLLAAAEKTPASAISLATSTLVWAEVNIMNGTGSVYYTATYGANNNHAGRSNAGGHLAYERNIEDGFLLTNLIANTKIGIWGVKK